MGHDAFISYSHAVDSKLATAVESGLEKLAKPLLKLRAMEVFRDETSLAANPELWAGIVGHLSASRWLLVLACPESASSYYCNKEVLWWLENRGPQQMLILLTGGELVWDEQATDFDWSRTTALPRKLSGQLKGEPLYVDLRWARAQEKLTLTDSRFRSAVLGVAAPLRGIAKNLLDGEDVRQHRRNRWLARSAVTAVGVAAIVAAWQAYVATQAQQAEARQRKVAEQAAQRAEVQRAEAVFAGAEAENQAIVAQAQQAEAEHRRDEAQRQRQRADERARIALARQLLA